MSSGRDVWAFRHPLPWLWNHGSKFPWSLTQEEKNAVAQQYFVGGAENVARSAGAFKVEGWIGCFGASYLMPKARPERIFARAGGAEIAATPSLEDFTSDPAWGRPEFEAWHWQLQIPAEQIPPGASDITFYARAYWGGESQVDGRITLVSPKQ